MIFVCVCNVNFPHLGLLFLIDRCLHQSFLNPPSKGRPNFELDQIRRGIKIGLFDN